MTRTSSGNWPRLAVAVATFVAVVAAIAFPSPASAAAPWKAAEQIRSSLFDAQAALLLDGGGGSEAERAQQELAVVSGLTGLEGVLRMQL